MSSTPAKKMSIDAVVQLVRSGQSASEDSQLETSDLDGAELNLEEQNNSESTQAVDVESIYQWRLCDDEGRWLGETKTGTVQTLRESFAASASDIPICLVLSGTEVITQPVTVNAKERRHLHKLVPFELEDSLTDEIEDLHFALGTLSEDSLIAAYVNNEWLANQLEELESAGFEVAHCFSQPLMLPRETNAWTLHLDDQLNVHYGDGLGFSVEPSLAPIVLASLAENNPVPEKILLLAADQYHVDLLYQYLPETIKQALQTQTDNAELEQSSSDRLEAKIAEGWDSFDISRAADLDLRQGNYARQLPLKKWWNEWRNVSVLAVVALLVYVGINITQIQVYKAKRADVVAERSAVFSQVVQGREQDAEKQLKNKLAEYETSSTGGSVIEMYAQVAPLITANSDIQLRTLRYTNQTGDMQLTLEAKSYGSVLALSEEINKKGLQARLQNTSQQGEQQQARMVISRAAL